MPLEGRPGPMGLLGRPDLATARARVERADAVHLHTPWETANRQLAHLARQAGVPYVLSPHGMLDDWSMAQKGLKKRLYLRLGGRRLLERAGFVHCTADAELEQAASWFSGRSRVIPLVFDLEPYRALPGAEAARRRWPALAGETPVLLFLSRLHYKKGPDVLLEAAAILRQRGVAFHLLFAGTGDGGYERSLLELRERLELTESTTFAGLVVGDDKLSLYQAADLFVLPTSQENFGLVFPEALATETPVLTTRGVDIWPELERSGGAEIISREPREIAEAIERLLAEPDRLRQMGAAGRGWAFETFAEERLLERYEALYRDAGSQHPPT